MSALEHMGMAGGPKMVVEEEAVSDYNGKSTLKEPRYKVYKTQLTFKWVRLRCLAAAAAHRGACPEILAAHALASVGMHNIMRRTSSHRSKLDVRGGGSASTREVFDVLSDPSFCEKLSSKSASSRLALCSSFALCLERR
jgi:hypothetical protein